MRTSFCRVEIPVTFNLSVIMLSVPAAPTIVAIPTENWTSRLSPKLTVAAVPTALPLSLIVIPDPIPMTPVSADPSPENSVALTVPKTSSSLSGFVVAIPTRPDRVIRSLSFWPAVSNVKLLSRAPIKLFWVLLTSCRLILTWDWPVSYTHLTLPTKRIV